jgi:tetratricopeptide (TPR) repeat protein
LTEGWQRLHLFQALAQALLHSHSAVLLVLEDVQWCDRDTLDWLHHVLTAKRGHEVRPQVLAAATLRNEAREEASSLAAWQAQLAHAGRLDEIELGPLSPESTLALAGHIAGQPLDPALGPLLYRGTEGNPLFIVEMVRAGLGSAASGSHQTIHAKAMLTTPAPLPAKVRQVLEARLAQLSLPARAVIELAAVLGREWSYSVLARASDLSEDVLVGCLDECWRRRIIRERGEEDYDFSHDKLREAAEALLGWPPHDEGETAWWEEWCQVQIDQLLLHYWWDRPDAMAARLECVRPLIERHGTPMQRSALYSNLARQLNRSSRFGPSDEALDHARAAVHALPPDAAPEVRGWPQFSLGFNLLMHGDHAEAEVELLAALAVAEQTGDLTMQTRCLAYLTIAARRQGDAAGVESYARRCLDLARTARMFDYIGAGQAGLAWVAWQRSMAAAAPADDLAEAERRGQLALEAWQRHPRSIPSAGRRCGR